MAKDKTMQPQTRNRFNPIAALAILEDHVNARLTILHVLAISLIPIAFSIAYQRGGVAHPEIYKYLPQYLSGRPLFVILYDSKILDMDLYQARELSYFFDFVDCKFIEFSVLHGYPHFLSITTYLFLLSIGLSLWYFSVKMAALPPLTGLAIVMLFWTSPSVFLAGSYFRSSKNGVALAGAILFLILYKLLSADDSNPRKYISKTTWLTLFGVGWAATLFDRQGFYLVGMIVLFVLFWHGSFPHRSNLVLLGAFGAVLIVSLIYNLWVAPFLTERLNHYQPNFSYQALPWEKFINAPLAYIAAGMLLYMDTLRFMLGNLPLEAAAPGLVIIIIEVLRRVFKNRKAGENMSKFDVAATGLIFCNVVLLIGLNILMVLRHPPLLWPDVRRVYYWLPQAVILFMTLALCLSRLKNLKGTYRHAISILLILAVAGNIIAIPRHHAYLAQGHLKEYFEFTPELLVALANLENAQYPATPDVMQNPVYQHFRTMLTP